jgi:uncharacterized phage protein (TIGR01671 family)
MGNIHSRPERGNKMRYKFRAWDTKVNKMFYSDDCFFSFITGNLIERDGENGSDQDSQIVMQYIGVKDSTGKEIYEGDIVALKDNDNIKFKIVWDFNACAYFTAYNDKELMYYSDMDLSRYMKVIGNIYENPEFTISDESQYDEILKSTHFYNED